MTEMIENFAGSYLFEGYDEEYEDFESALMAFLDDLSPVLLTQFSQELDKILVDHPGNDALETALENIGWTETTENGDTRELVKYTQELTHEYMREANR